MVFSHEKAPDVMTSLWPGNLWSAEAEAGHSQLMRGWREKQTYGDSDTQGEGDTCYCPQATSQQLSAVITSRSRHRGELCVSGVARERNKEEQVLIME